MHILKLKERVQCDQRMQWRTCNRNVNTNRTSNGQQPNHWLQHRMCQTPNNDCLNVFYNTTTLTTMNRFTKLYLMRKLHCWKTASVLERLKTFQLNETDARTEQRQLNYLCYVCLRLCIWILAQKQKQRQLNETDAGTETASTEWTIYVIYV